MSIVAPILLAAAMAADAPPIRTAAELHALPNDAFAQGRAFEITGTVALALYDRHFLLIDDTGGAYVKRDDGVTVSPGDVVRVAGIAKYGRDHERMLEGRTTVRIDTTNPPAAIDANAENLVRGDFDWRLVRVKGRVRDAFRDEIDPRWCYLVLNCDTHIIYAAIHEPEIAKHRPASLIDAVVSARGVCRPTSGGRRFFLGRHIAMSGFSDITMLERAPDNPFDAPILEDINQMQPGSVLCMKRHRAIGTVIAVWHGDRFLIETDSGRLVRAEVAEGSSLPAFGEGVEVVGFPVTDLYRVNLSRAIFRQAKTVPRHHTIQDVVPEDILKDPDGKTKIMTEYHGRTIRICGFVRSLPPPENSNGRVNVECGDYVVPVDVSACPESMNDIGPGTELAITGTCIFDTSDWYPSAPFPRIDEFLLVVRRPDDVKVISIPPWWTSAVLFIVIGSLFAALGVIAIWNRMLNRVIEHRTRELAKERFAKEGANLKVEERTRLAVELHDNIAQNLTGISLQLDAAQLAAEEDPNSVMPYLETARRKMQNCRENLRNCLWDLRSRAFEERGLADAIRKTIEPHTDGAEIQINMDIQCRELSDNAIHAVLCIIRELVVNATRHGEAKHISISGRLDESGMAFEVADDGIGFDPSNRPGMSSGHFGLQGISERVRRLGGTFDISSAPGEGTTATLKHLTPEP